MGICTIGNLTFSPNEMSKFSMRMSLLLLLPEASARASFLLITWLAVASCVLYLLNRD